MAKEMEPLRVFEHEIELHRRMFEASPVSIIATYLQCFQSDGSQARLVPQHILEALAQRFLLFMNGQTRTLDQAFGGSIARQRNRLREADRNWGVIWDFLAEMDRIKKEPRETRARSTPFEIAVERTAKKHRMSEDNVLRIYKGGRQR